MPGTGGFRKLRSLEGPKTRQRPQGRPTDHQPDRVITSKVSDGKTRETTATVREMPKRKIFDEVMEGVSAMKSHRERKITLRSYKIEAAPLPKVDSKLIRDTRKRLRCSRAVFARKLRINERTLEKWEQGRAKPNGQAAALVLLVRNYPDTLDRLERVAGG
jgi:putative transcriptional regulator